MRALRSGLPVLLVGFLITVTGCGADFETEEFSTDFADGLEQAENISGLGPSAPQALPSGGSLETLVTLVPAEEDGLRATVDIYRMSDLPGVPADEDGLVAGMSQVMSMLGASENGTEPRRTELDGAPAFEMSAGPGAVSLAGPAASRMLIAGRGGDLYVIVQLAVDSAGLAETAIGLDKIVDSWEWKD